jgi:hypothetical protein
MNTEDEYAYDPDAKIAEGLRQSANGETEYLGSFEQYADDEIEEEN